MSPKSNYLKVDMPVYVIAQIQTTCMNISACSSNVSWIKTQCCFPEGIAFLNEMVIIKLFMFAYFFF